MFDQAPQRPAVLPSILFLSATFAGLDCRSLGSLVPLGLTMVCAANLIYRRPRRFDRVLIFLATLLGLVNGVLGASALDSARGEAARELPLGLPFARSWVGVIRSPAAPGVANIWTFEVDARPESSTQRTARAIGLRLTFPGNGSSPRAQGEALRAGKRIRFWARVRLPDARSESERLWRDRILATGHIKSVQLIESLPTPGNPHAFIRYRQRSAQRLQRIYGHDRALHSFLAAALLGDRRSRDLQLEQELRAVGLAHLLAISGLHVGIVAWVLLGVCRRLLRRPFVFTIVAGLLLLGFGASVGGSIPVQRAIGAALVLIGGRAIGRDGEALNRLACIATALAVFDPQQIRSAGFALSFAATAGILLSLQRGARCGLVASSLRISLAAYIATAPLSALYFGQLAPWSPCANLLALPFVFLVIGAGYGSLLLAGIPIAGTLLAAVTTFAFEAIRSVAVSFHALPLSPLPVAAPSTLVWTTFVVAGGLFLLAGRSGRPTRTVGLLLLGAGLLSLHLGPPPPTGRPMARLFAVGQGQSLLWHDGDEATLVDTGGRGYGSWDPGERVVRPALLELGLRRIDRLILSHGDADHAAGARALLAGLEVGELWLGPAWWRDRRLSALAALARRRGIAVRMVSAGDTVGAVQIHSPERSPIGRTSNERSLVITLGRRPYRIFVPGDLDGAALRKLLATNRLPQAEALVLAHHGSRTGTSTELLAQIRPELALASCGWKNRFGHPSAEATGSLSRAGIPLWRTDHDGTIGLDAATTGWVAHTER